LKGSGWFLAVLKAAYQMSLTITIRFTKLLKLLNQQGAETMRNSRIDAQDNGMISIRLAVPPRIWSLVCRISERVGVAELQAMKMMLHRLDLLIQQTRGDVLGLEYREAFDALLAQDAMPAEDGTVIDHSRLHRGDTKSGFVGVYANGYGFRAMAKMPGQGAIQRSIGTFSTAERAAWARYLHYKNFGLAYGEVESRMDELRKKSPTFARNFDDARLRHFVIWSAKHDADSPIEGLDPEDRALEDVDFWNTLDSKEAIELADRLTPTYMKGQAAATQLVGQAEAAKAANQTTRMLSEDDIDPTKLVRSNRTNSGFVGVYANGNGFRAMAKINGRMGVVGTFPTGELAAWARYLYLSKSPADQAHTIEVDEAADPP